MRTNNDVEGYHRRLNGKCRHAAMPFYELIEVLHAEAMMVSYELRCMGIKRVRQCQRKKYAAINDQLTVLWEQYDNKSVTASSFLRRCSRLQLPIGIGI